VAVALGLKADQAETMRVQRVHEVRPLRAARCTRVAPPAAPIARARVHSLGGGMALSLGTQRARLHSVL